MKTALMLVTAALVLSAPLDAATLHGRVTGPAAGKKTEGGGYSRGVFLPAAPKKDDSAPAASAMESQDSTVVVWAEPLDTPAAFHQPAAKPTMMQKDKKFIPVVLAVQKGTTVGFPNLDPLYHNVFSYSRTKRFDLGRYAGGKSKDVTFDETGVVEVFCEIHETMHAWILVLDSPYFTVISPDSDYRLELPAGRYRVRAWAPNQEGRPQTVTVSAAEGAEADFSF